MSLLHTAKLPISISKSLHVLHKKTGRGSHLLPSPLRPQVGCTSISQSNCSTWSSVDYVTKSGLPLKQRTMVRVKEKAILIFYFRERVSSGWSSAHFENIMIIIIESCTSLWNYIKLSLSWIRYFCWNHVCDVCSRQQRRRRWRVFTDRGFKPRRVLRSTDRTRAQVDVRSEHHQWWEKWPSCISTWSSCLCRRDRLVSGRCTRRNLVWSFR